MSKRRKQRPLKQYEIDENVIDLDAYVKFHTKEYFPLRLYEGEDVPYEDYIKFESEDDFFDIDFDILLDWSSQDDE